MKNTMNNSMTMVLDLGDLGMVTGGVMTGEQKERLTGYATVFKRCDISIEEALYSLTYIVKHGGSFPEVTEEEVTEIIRSVYGGA